MPPESTAAAATTAAASKEYKPLGLRLHVNSPFISYVFIKHHVAHDSESEVANALYVTGLPLGLDAVSLESIFAVFGEVANVVVHPTKVSSLQSARFSKQQRSAQSPAAGSCPPIHRVPVALASALACAPA